jgi:hypothetical protein
MRLLEQAAMGGHDRLLFHASGKELNKDVPSEGGAKWKRRPAAFPAQ